MGPAREPFFQGKELGRASAVGDNGRKRRASEVGLSKSSTCPGVTVKDQQEEKLAKKRRTVREREESQGGARFVEKEGFQGDL